ncbi:MAG: DUF4331 domain-containing protein [Panacagrimonas sp.]
MKKLLLTSMAASLSLGLSAVQASSHREAPFITETPKVDGSDFYAFRSYEPGRAAYVTFLANYLPLQDPYGGPNYFKLDRDALYEIHVSNDGDAEEELTFQFRFRDNNKDITLQVGAPGAQQTVSIPLAIAGQVGNAAGTGALNTVERYTVSVIRGARRSGTPEPIANLETGATTFRKPVDNIGNKTIPDYPRYANTHIYDISIPGCATAGRVFAGQRKEGFVVNLGETFDLINFNPLGPVDGEDNTLEDKNITTLALEVPIACLTAGNEPVIGAWTTASLPRVRILAERPEQVRAARDVRDFVQVSRLGMPLVNEVVIGLKDKDLFNRSEPKDDGQFATYVTHPTLPELIEILFAGPLQLTDVAPNNFPRTDLVAAFLTGIPTLNQPANVAASEMVRLNTGIAPTARGAQLSLGVLAGDNAGFPNGRRPGDDVVDAEIRVAMGALCHALPGAFCTPADAPVGNAPLTDGAEVSASDFDQGFPYLLTPLAGSPSDD